MMLDRDFARHYMRVSRARNMVTLAAAAGLVIGVSVVSFGVMLGVV